MKTKQMVMGTAAGLAAGAVLGWSLRQAQISPVERMVHRKFQCVKHCVHKWTQLLGV